MSKQIKTTRRTKRKRVLKKTRRKQKGGGKAVSANANQGKEKEKPARKKQSSAKQETNDVCAICLDGMSEFKEKLISCVNNHKFHDDCISPWCAGRRPCLCPTCRGVVKTDAAVASARQDINAPVQRDRYAPVTGGQVIIGQGYPRGLQFTLLPPSFDDRHSALSPDGFRRWPPDYRPTEQEIIDWDIKMSWYWWTTDDNLPIGWYRIYDDSDNNRYNDLAYIEGVTTVREEEDYTRPDDNYDAPSWMIVGNQNQPQAQEFVFPAPPAREAPPPPPSGSGWLNLWRR